MNFSFMFNLLLHLNIMSEADFYVVSVLFLNAEASVI